MLWEGLAGLGVPSANNVPRNVDVLDGTRKRAALFFALIGIVGSDMSERARVAMRFVSGKDKRPPDDAPHNPMRVATGDRLFVHDAW